MKTNTLLVLILSQCSVQYPFSHKDKRGNYIKAAQRKEPVNRQELSRHQLCAPSARKTRPPSRLIARTSRLYNGITYDISDSFNIIVLKGEKGTLSRKFSK